MKNYVITFLLLVILSSSTCHKDSLTCGELGDVFQMNYGEQCTMDNGNLTFQFFEVSDSRCPYSVQCVWAGQGEVTLKLETKKVGIDTEDGPQTLVLQLPGLSDESVRDTFGNYVFELQELSPYPKEGVEVRKSEYVAKMKIDKI